MSSLTQDGTAEPVSRETKFSGANGNREIFIFPVQLTTSRIDNLSRLIHTCTRALSLRNLDLGSECGRVFPAGVRPASPSRDAANCLSSRFSQSVETRRRYGWWRMVFPTCAPLPSSNLVSFGRLLLLLLLLLLLCPSGGGGTREAGGTVAGSLVALYQAGTHRIRRQRRAARSWTSQRSTEPLCARIKGANGEVSEGKSDL